MPSRTRPAHVLERAILGVGVLAATLSASLAPSRARSSVDQAWPAFALVTGLLVIGYLASQDGLFERAGYAIARLPGNDITLFVVAMGLVAAVTVVFNLDTSVLFLTPTLIHVARARHVAEEPYVYGAVMMSNSASLFLPGSNLTNLIVFHDKAAGWTFAARMFPAWLGAVVVTTCVLAIRLRKDGVPNGSSARADLQVGEGTLAAVLATVLIALTRSPALLVLVVAMVALLVRGGRQRLEPVAARHLDPSIIAGLFGIVVAIGTLARTWSGPAGVMRSASPWAAAAIGGAASVAINNLPAAMLLSAKGVAHARALLVGLNIGPNLAVSGSLSAVLWAKAARSEGAETSARRYSRVGLVVAPLAGAAAMAGLLLFSGRPV
jgi:arsenical pump membrane protein